VLGAAHDLSGDHRIQLALGLVAGAAHRGPLGGHGARGDVPQRVDQRAGIVGELRRGGPLHPHADGVAIGGEQVGLHDQRGRGVERGRCGYLAHEELALELEVPESLLRHASTVAGEAAVSLQETAQTSV
jgi:hypothetical protein